MMNKCSTSAIPSATRLAEGAHHTGRSAPTDVGVGSAQIAISGDNAAAPLSRLFSI